jgi:GNAT superfamily N-acetyltransferase
MAAVTTTYLEMSFRAQLRPKPSTDANLLIHPAGVRLWQVNRYLYQLVGASWAWRDKLNWNDDQWRAYAEADTLRLVVAYYGAHLAGYYELAEQNDEIEIAYFGLAPGFIGKGLGGPLLTHALEYAWQLRPRRIWVHTCTLDHPAALGNYQARGMVIYKTENRPAA